MSSPSQPRRKYDSPRRREQALATRRVILEAASRSFLASGYAGTTIEAIAAAARVSPESVYATFGTKRALLTSVIDVAIAGDVEPVPVMERDWVRQLSSERTLGRRIALLAAGGRAILERRARIDAVASAAALADPEIAALVASSEADRLRGQRELLRIVAGETGFGRGLGLDEAADILFAIGSPAVYRLLVDGRGWSAERFEAWYADAIERLLFEGA